MKIYIASDHAGFQTKQDLIPFLKERGLEVIDFGPRFYEHEDDYPDYISVVARKVSEDFLVDSNIRGIVIGWSGQGEAIVANRFPNVRCAVFYGGPKHVLSLTRDHNDANVLSLGAHFLTKEDVQKSVLLWLTTKFSGDERHIRRIEKIEKYPNE